MVPLVWKIVGLHVKAFSFCFSVKLDAYFIIILNIDKILYYVNESLGFGFLQYAAILVKWHLITFELEKNYCRNRQNNLLGS